VAVTALDVGTLAASSTRGRLDVVRADVLAVGVASASSFALHRRITFGDDPYVRWVDRPGVFALAALAAGTVDVGITRLLAGASPAPSRLLTAKLSGLAAAATLRLVAYRAALLPDVRRSLTARTTTGPPPGDLRLSVVVPAHDEAARIGSAVHGIRGALAAVEEDGGLEIVVVDDGSADGTADEAAAAGATVLRLPSNRGKGAAVRAGVLASSGRCVAFTDADLAYPPALLLDLLAAVEAGTDVAVGNRQHPGSRSEGGTPLLRTVSGRLFNALAATVLLGQYRDTQCGLKAFRADAARQIFTRTRLDGFAFDVEVLHLVERDRLSLAEIPVTLLRTSGSSVRVVLDAARMVRDLFQVRRWSGQGRYDRPSTPLAGTAGTSGAGTAGAATGVARSPGPGGSGDVGEPGAAGSVGSATARTSGGSGAPGRAAPPR
jgi:putative flippase GtrA